MFLADKIKKYKDAIFVSLHGEINKLFKYSSFVFLVGELINKYKYTTSVFLACKIIRKCKYAAFVFLAVEIINKYKYSTNTNIQLLHILLVRKLTIKYTTLTFFADEIIKIRKYMPSVFPSW